MMEANLVMLWQDVPVKLYLDRALTLSRDEQSRLEGALAVLPSVIIDAHSHIARSVDIETLSTTLMSHIVSTFPVYTFQMAETVKRVLWTRKIVRSARMAHANSGYRHNVINEYLLRDLPKGDLMICFGLPNEPREIMQFILQKQVVALKMYFQSVDPPLSTVQEVFPDMILAAAEQQRIPIILHLPTPLPHGLSEVMEIAFRHPGLMIVLAHLGGHGGQGFTPQVRKAYAAIRDLKNVFMDTAFVWDSNLIHTAVDALGPERILFGTNEPLSLIRAIGYNHPQLGPRLYAPDYHWATDDDVPTTVRNQTPVLLHIQMIDAIVEAVSHDQGTLKQIFHDNAERLFMTQRSAHSLM